MITSQGEGDVGLMENCLHVSGIGINLISLTQLHQLGFSVHFVNSTCNIYKHTEADLAAGVHTNGTLVYTTPQEENLYPINDLAWLGIRDWSLDGVQRS